VYRIEAALTSS
jgi:hypothetical protein